MKDKVLHDGKRKSVDGQVREFEEDLQNKVDGTITSSFGQNLKLSMS